MDQQKPLLLESLLNRLGAWISDFRVPLLASFLSGGLAYGFFFTNKLINHDEAYNLFLKGASISSGRWGLDILERIFPNFSMPWLYGLMTLALIAAAVCIITALFGIRNRLLQVLLAGSITVFPSLTGTMAYTFTSSSFALSFLLAVLAVLLISRPTKRTVIPALCCMVFSLGIYQSYISLAAGLLVLLLIRQLLEGSEVKVVLKRGVLYLLFLIVSLAGYFVATKLLQRIVNVGFNGYASANLSFHLADLPGRVGVAYGNFFRFFLDGYRGLMPTGFSRLLHLMVLAAAVLMLAVLAARKGADLPRLLLLGLLTLLLPLAINCMYLFTTEESVHTLVLYGFVSFYVLALLLAQLCLADRGRIVQNVLSIAMALIILSNICIANEAALNLYLRYENAFSFYTSLTADIKRMPQFDETTSLAIAGQYRSPDFYYEHFDEATAITGTAGFYPDNYSKNAFVEYYLGFPITFATDEETAAITATEEYAQMPVYPYYGSMKFFGDTLVVKLS